MISAPSPPASGNSTPTVSCDITLRGRVQGVGFRPFVYRLAQDLALCGSVRNRMGEVTIAVEGGEGAVEQFRQQLLSAAPPLSRPEIHTVDLRPLRHFSAFVIEESSQEERGAIHLPPDHNLCPLCRHDLDDRDNRRYHYPFTNCTQCGPRYTIIEALPYDRAATSMAPFPLCPDCLQEYRNPGDRRFHAEPIACPR
ncbi:MAG: acylphosphatase, partial [Gammaproteobacteria bacterium]|nr:acylphosphatase [Gammaproteobacteria bacterium]